MELSWQYCTVQATHVNRWIHLLFHKRLMIMQIYLWAIFVENFSLYNYWNYIEATVHWACTVQSTPYRSYSSYLSKGDYLSIIFTAETLQFTLQPFKTYIFMLFTESDWSLLPRVWIVRTGCSVAPGNCHWGCSSSLRVS